MLRHLRLPSFQPAIATLAMNGSVMTSCTPGTLRMCQPKRSTLLIRSWLRHSGCCDSTIAVSTSTPMLNLVVITSLSRL